MLRLAHRILKQGLIIKANDPTYGKEFLRVGNTIYDNIKNCQIIIADNVAEYVQTVGRSALGQVEHATPGMLLLEQKDIPNVLPPFELMFVEWIPVGEHDTAGVLESAVFFDTVPAEEAVKSGRVSHGDFEIQEDPFAHVVALHVYCNKKGEAIYDGNYFSYWVDRHGKMSNKGNRRIEGADFWYSPIATPLMAISFMHCKNVNRTDATASEGPEERWLRRQKQPSLRYHVLEIDPMKEVLRTEGCAESTGLKRALHICRGHFATYTEGKPLFGRTVGTFWVPSHVRGSSKHGVVVKDYNVKSPISR